MIGLWSIVWNHKCHQPCICRKLVIIDARYLFFYFLQCASSVGTKMKKQKGNCVQICIYFNIFFQVTLHNISFSFPDD
uniref:Uncharacterized protein n=1 Tax=Cannabis sativa TaxID=3483 RepID=A0A803R3Y5_CANSA